MTDILLDITPDGVDVALAGGDLALDLGLQTAVVVSLFTDARAEDEEELPDGSADRRGWWGSDPAAELGSRLWLTDRSKAVQDTANRVREAIAKALRWLLELGIADRVEVVAERARPGEIVATVEIERGSAREWDHLWAGVAATDFVAGSVRVKLLSY